MMTLAIAFTPEGPTDSRFLTSIIERTAIDILQQASRQQVDVLPVTLFRRPHGAHSGAERLLAVAREAKGFQLLVVHADADAATPEAALTERIEPGKQLISLETLATACTTVVALIPIHMVEAWMLADHELLQKNLGTSLDLISELGIPRPNRAEQIANPKQLLTTATQTIRQLPRRSRRAAVEIADLYDSLAEMHLEKLRALPSYCAFRDALETALRSLNLLAE